MKTRIILILMTLVALVPLTSFSQTFSHLYDFDSTYAYGWHVFVAPSGNYRVFGEATDPHTGVAFISSMEISANGDSLLAKASLKYDSVQIYSATPRQAVQLANGGYLLPVTIQTAIGPVRSLGGLAKFDANGDTLFVKTYTDTSLYFDYADACAVMSNGDYLFGSTHELYPSTSYPSRIIRTDGDGNIKWVRSYQKVLGEGTVINTIVPLGADRILVGAMSSTAILMPQAYVPRNHPWFLILDTAGNILKDSLYGDPYWGAGAIFADINGGYFHTGWIDSFPDPDPSSVIDAPNYIAHLDTNFKIDWITRFNFTDSAVGKRYISVARQLNDGNVILAGESYATANGWARGWVAKVSHTGSMIWNHNYYLNPHYDNEFMDAVEKNDGSLAIIGTSFNDSLPTWRQHKDVWLLSLDSNGCVDPGCGNGLAVARVSTKANNVVLYPNPVNSSFTIEANAPGTLEVFNLEGQKIFASNVEKTKKLLSFPLTVPAGVYIAKYVTKAGEITILKIEYQPM